MTTNKFRWLFPTTDMQVIKLFRNRGYEIVTMHNKHKGFDGVVFTGGEDVTPFLYGDSCHQLTEYNLARDLMENALFREVPTNMPKVGICRGAQFLNVMSGGRMYQHVTGHCVPHKVMDTTDHRVFEVTSTHHQMMQPSDNGWVMLAADVATNLQTANTNFTYKLGEENEMDDVEAVHYYNTSSFCYQPHPEYGTASKECTDWFWEAIDFLFEKELKKHEPNVAQPAKVG